jgi:prevent-host-death family protein
MAEGSPKVITSSVQDTRKNFADLLGQVQHGGKTVEITKNGKTAAYLVSREAFERARDAGLVGDRPANDSSPDQSAGAAEEPGDAD